jgi:hypothetical protein
VFPFGSVAVAVMNLPAATAGAVAEKPALQEASVVTDAEPMSFWPSPKPDGSQLAVALFVLLHFVRE